MEKEDIRNYLKERLNYCENELPNDTLLKKFAETTESNSEHIVLVAQHSCLKAAINAILEPANR